jgi:hypothetical protein
MWWRAYWPLFAFVMLAILGQSISWGLKQAPPYNREQPASSQSKGDPFSRPAAARSTEKDNAKGHEGGHWYDTFLDHTAECLIAIFTGTLWWSTRKLWLAGERQMQMLDRHASQQDQNARASVMQAIRSADAATEAAKAAELSARASVSAERAYIAGGINFRNLFEGDSVMLVTMSNYGKTPAFIGTVAVGICPEERLNERPKWNAAIRFAGHVLPYHPDVRNPLKSDIVFDFPIIARLFPTVRGRRQHCRANARTRYCRGAGRL